MNFFAQAKKWVVEITEISLLLVGLAIIIEILFGQTVPFFGGVVANLTNLITSLGENGFVGLVVLGVILFLFSRSNTVRS